MKRHPFDAVSFVLGALLLVVVVLTVGEFGLSTEISRWVLPSAVFVIGLSILALTVRSIVSTKPKP